MNDIDSQFDLIQTELQEKFLPQRNRNLRLSRIYTDLGELKRSEKVHDCGTSLDFRFTEDGTEAPTLYRANFCKDRLCSMCGWRRTLKIFGQVSRVMDEIQDTYQFVFVTLTVRNCSADLLSATVSKIQEGFFRFTHKSKKIRSSFLGYFKALEITRNVENTPDLEWHPHLHCIFAVDKDYFRSEDYVSYAELRQFWQKAMGIDYAPQVYIQKVRPNENDVLDPIEEVSLGKAVAEVAKYTLKSDDYLSKGDPKLTGHTVLTLLEALTSRRLCSFGGIFKKVAHELDLDDLTDGDLVLTNGDQIRRDVAHLLVSYEWQIGYGYQRRFVRQESPDDEPKNKRRKGKKK